MVEYDATAQIFDDPRVPETQHESLHNLNPVSPKTLRSTEVLSNSMAGALELSPSSLKVNGAYRAYLICAL